MIVELPYGETKKIFSTPDGISCSILSFHNGAYPIEVNNHLVEKLVKPTVGKSLFSLLQDKQPKKIVIVVNDSSRSTPTLSILNPLLKYLKDLHIQTRSITIVIATGTHRLTTESEKVKMFGEEICTQYKIVSHDCRSDTLKFVGEIESDLPLYVNKNVVDADFRITIGEILFHYYAGFSGGRKSIFPGVSNEQAILANHAKMVSQKSYLGHLEDNPVHLDMMKSLDLCPVDFGINVICNEEKKITNLFTGDATKSWQKGVEEFRSLFSIPIQRQSDMVIVSAGGFPKDINLYQAHKAIELTANVVKPGGKILLVSECREKYGHAVFEHFAAKKSSPKEVNQYMKEKFIFGLHKLFYLARLKERYRLFLYSNFSKEETASVFMEKVDSIEDFLAKDYSSKFCYIIPQGGMSFYRLKTKKKG